MRIAMSDEQLERAEWLRLMRAYVQLLNAHQIPIPHDLASRTRELAKGRV